MNFPVNIMEKFSEIENYWSPRVIGEVNDQYIKIAKLKDQLVWHSHENEDELFYVVKGNLRIELEGESVLIKQGEIYTIPKMVRHNPVAEEECWVVLIESKGTKHTGDVQIARTKSIEDQLLS